MNIVVCFNQWAARIVGSALALVFLGITFILCFNVITRYLFGYALFWAEELTNYIIIWITFLGSALCVRRGMHVSIDLIHQYASPGGRLVLNTLGLVAGLLFTVIISILGFKQVAAVYATGQITAALRIPMYVPYMAIPLGGVLMLGEQLEAIFNLFTAEKSEHR